MTRSSLRLLSSIGFLAMALAPARAWAVTDNVCSFPVGLTGWTFNQNAFQAQNAIRLTDAVANEDSSAFMSTAIPLTAATPVHAHFTFQMGPGGMGGDGLAFVMHNAAAGASALGTGTAGGMGYATITPSVIIEFDTYKNAGGDPNANHVGLMLNGSATTHTATGTPGFTMAGGGVLNAWVDYDPVGHTISVYLAQASAKPATAVLSHALNLFTQVGTQMYVGFTSSTGSATATPAETNEHDVYELEVSTDGVPCACDGDTACSGATPACGASGLCVVCSTTNHTACTGATPVCDVPADKCVGCLTNANCSSPKPICDSTNLTCRACSGKADCGGATPVCATTGANAGDCVVCASDMDCGGATPRCSTNNTCVQCTGNTDCGGDTPVCNGNVCKPCASDADCGGSTPACEVWGACGQCSSTNGGQCTGATSICDFPTGTCVGCEFNSDCSGMKPTCNTTSHTCQPCMVNADCAGNPSGPACVTSGMKKGSCVICEQDSDCTSAAAPKCDTVANLCVQCLTNGDCSGSTPVCSTSSNICVGCLTNADCSGSTPICDTSSSTCKPCQNDYAAANPGPLSCPNAMMPACQPGGTPNAGQCLLCSSLDNSACATLPATPVCIAATATCGCVNDSDCNADSYCDTSTVATGTCTPGCRVADSDGGTGGTTNCSTGKYCSIPDGGSIGTCTSEPCNSNGDCSGATPVCDTIDQPHVCVQCLNDPDCKNSQVCDQTNHCVECTPNQKQNCLPTGKGAACLASETCGCATDADCGGANSGRVCNTSKQTCEMGCRGNGGNGCPPPQTCSSMDGSIGTCQGGTASSSSETSASSSSSSSGTGGAGGGTGAAGGIVSQSQGCGCRTAGGDDDARLFGLGALLAGLAVSAHRTRRRRAR